LGDAKVANLGLLVGFRRRLPSHRRSGPARDLGLGPGGKWRRPGGRAPGWKGVEKRGQGGKSPWKGGWGGRPYLRRRRGPLCAHGRRPRKVEGARSIRVPLRFLRFQAVSEGGRSVLREETLHRRKLGSEFASDSRPRF
jgi:hypothetical protein